MNNSESKTFPVYQETSSILIQTICAELQSQLIDLLEADQFNLIFSSNNQTSIEKLSSNKVDILLLDITTPIINSEAIIETISNFQYWQTPTVMLLSSTDISFREQGFQAGAIDFIIKPILKDELLLRLSSHFGASKELLLESLIVQLQSELADFIDAEKELNASKVRYQQMFETNLAIKMIIDPDDGKIIDANNAACNFYGYDKSKLTTMHIMDINQLSEEEIRLEMKKARLEERLNFNFRHLLANGEVKDVEVYSGPVKSNGKTLLYSIIHDITARKAAEKEKDNLEKQLRQSQKMETIGTLTRGIAHDFNNILTPIMGYADMALHSIDENHDLYSHFERIYRGTHRAKELIEQILLFSKQTEKEWHPVSLQNLIEEALKLLRPSIPKSIQIVREIDTSCPPILADESRILQIIVNLCTNAWQAMEIQGGILTLKLQYKNISPEFDSSETNNYACLSVIDTGVGMDIYTKERIFEPFFTTKAVNKGTGLGLSVVHGIVNNLQGKIIVTSQANIGTTFQIFFPLITEGKLNPISAPERIETGFERILFVDDELDVGNVVKDMLEMFNYQVDFFLSGAEALQAFKLEPEKYALLISDLSMPNMSGLELIKQIHTIRNDLPVIVMTGFGDNINLKTRQEYKINKLLSKPVTIKDLTSEIRDIIDHKRSEDS